MVCFILFFSREVTLYPYCPGKVDLWYLWYTVGLSWSKNCSNNIYVEIY